MQGAREMKSHPQRRTVAYVATLVVLASVLATALVLAGFTLEAPFTVFALAFAGASQNGSASDSRSRSVA